MCYRPNYPSGFIAVMLVLTFFIIDGCQEQPSPAAPATPTLQPTQRATRTPSETPTSTWTVVPTASHTPTEPLPLTATPAPTETPTPIPSPTVTPTPTSSFPVAKVLMRAFCRYGPGKAYLYSHELHEGDQAEIHGRNANGSWLWIKPQDLDRHCWVSASVVEVTGKLSGVPKVTTKLPHSTLYGPPAEVQAVRDGDHVTVSWSSVWMTVDDKRGYLIEANICQNGNLISVAVQTETTSYEFTDQQICSGASGGKLYAVEKHGYTDPVIIPWP